MTGQADDIQWYIARDGKQHGPLTDVELRTFVAHSYLRQSDLIWRPGMNEWQAAPVVFPTAFQTEAPQAAQAPRAAQPAPAQTYAAQQNNAAAAQRVARSSDFESSPEPRLDRNRIKRLALASMAITVIGGGALALAYHRPLMEMVSGSSSSASADQPPVVMAPADTKVADADPPAAATQTDGSPAASAEPSPTSAGADVIPSSPPPATPTAQAQEPQDSPSQAQAAAPSAPAQQPTTTASVSTSPAETPKDTQVAAVEAQPPAPPPPSIDGSPLDVRLQKIPVWELIKKDYPDWYSSQISSANKLVADKKPDNEVAMSLAQGLVNLRRQNADKALAASSDKLQAIAVAFLQHLKKLRAQSVSACFGFISKGETSPAVVQMMEHPETATALNAQADAIFEAISEGAKNPVKHDSAVKSDYDVLIKELAKLGWKEEDLQVFSNPKLLAKREPDQVCKMVQEWFVAHLAVQDKAIRDRLLFETLKPVVSG
ncbi:MAG TPA: DUF4339 domain-containing protein [Hyphomicrobium sp.]